MDEFKYFYPVRLDKQLSLDGKVFSVPFYGEGHIEYNEVLMCGQAREVLIKKIRGDNSKVVRTRLNGRLCPICEERWKAHPDSPWSKWVKGQSIEAKIPTLFQPKSPVG